MRPSEGFTDRLWRAHRGLEDARGGEVSRAQLGALAAAALGRDKAFSQGTVSDWFTVGVRDADTIWAIAEACGVRAGWLAWNELPMRAALAEPVIMPTVPLTPVDLTAGAERARPAAGGKRRRR